ncbi:hypothetical protein AZI86_04155 [Bdellovibrio bacteriovorus]|uniref:D-alanyl-D-alanine carboxypeptidase n=1 Tax=Bdellovibrio bacteriovorus TaxID=959 RepID=A0A150WPN3_BDEBC|nr:hypothetical protein [Bdellovibrio bacteriovorus]KYG66259.1 hypothetical protein AZI86_04155 [Bdellovibrio bacteriovorus]
MNVISKSLKSLAAASILLAAPSAMAVKFSMNAMCYLQDKKDAQVRPFNPTESEAARSSKWVRNNPTNVSEGDLHEKFRIASLSKVLVSHWAIAKLGPEYRFTTKVHITPTNSDKSCFVHLSGDQDIFFGIEILSSTFQQLRKVMDEQNCERISQLSYDENIVIPFKSGRFIMQHREDSGFRGSDPDLFYGPITTPKALKEALAKTKSGQSLKVEKIGKSLASAFAEYKNTVPMRTFSFKSRPLHMMLREFNIYSSNVPPNILFEKLGGREAYKSFLASRLSMGDMQADVFNGSGYPVNPNTDRKDNMVSCSTFVRVVQDLDTMLTNYKGVRRFQMADVMGVGGTGETYTTFKSLYAAPMFHNTLVAKTGSANNAITFGGMISTAEGDLYFGAFTNPERYQELYQPREYIRDLVTIMAKRYQLKKFDYTQIGLMSPIDDMAKFKEEKNLSSSLK